MNSESPGFVGNGCSHTEPCSFPFPYKCVSQYSPDGAHCCYGQYAPPPPPPFDDDIPEFIALQHIPYDPDANGGAGGYGDLSNKPGTCDFNLYEGYCGGGTSCAESHPRQCITSDHQWAQQGAFCCVRLKSPDPEPCTQQRDHSCGGQCMQGERQCAGEDPFGYPGEVTVCCESSGPTPPPTTAAPTAPTTSAPTLQPTTASPTTPAPTLQPTTASPTTSPTPNPTFANDGTCFRMAQHLVGDFTEYNPESLTGNAAYGPGSPSPMVQAVYRGCRLACNVRYAWSLGESVNRNCILYYNGIIQDWTLYGMCMSGGGFYNTPVNGISFNRDNEVAFGNACTCCE